MKHAPAVLLAVAIHPSRVMRWSRVVTKASRNPVPPSGDATAPGHRAGLRSRSCRVRPREQWWEEGRPERRPPPRRAVRARSRPTSSDGWAERARGLPRRHERRLSRWRGQRHGDVGGQPVRARRSRRRVAGQPALKRGRKRAHAASRGSRHAVTAGHERARVQRRRQRRRLSQVAVSAGAVVRSRWTAAAAAHMAARPRRALGPGAETLGPRLWRQHPAAASSTTAAAHAHVPRHADVRRVCHLPAGRLPRAPLRTGARRHSRGAQRSIAWCRRPIPRSRRSWARAVSAWRSRSGAQPLVADPSLVEFARGVRVARRGARALACGARHRAHRPEMVFFRADPTRSDSCGSSHAERAGS